MMRILLFLMIFILVVCDTYYMGCIAVDANTAYISITQKRLMAHRVIGALLTMLAPVISRLLCRIDTSLHVEPVALGVFATLADTLLITCKRALLAIASDARRG